MHNLDDEIHRAIDSLVQERLVRASKKIRKELPSNIIRNRFYSLTYREGPVFIYLLLGEGMKEGVIKRINSNQSPIPGLITIKDSVSAGVRLEGSQLMQFSHVGFKNIFAFSVGSKVSAQITNVTIDLLEVEAVKEKFVVDLGFIISPEIGKQIFSPLDQIEDLLVQFASFMTMEHLPTSGSRKESADV